MSVTTRRQQRTEAKPGKRAKYVDRQAIRELYYLTEALNKLVGAVVQLALVGAACIITGIAIARAIYLLG
ncbi:hypothetical protein [Aeoliella sp.]|uniref:hypothetical protein n=1 Tax=Aeoliella sp. TaxID=2795800 RepID=UPI003CCBDD15